MGQTLTHGVYLPDEGERNCYNGLAANWQLLDGAVGTIAEHTSQIAGKAPAVHTHTKSDITDFPAYGNTAGTICEGNDSRLSDARTPVAHTHSKSDVTDLFDSVNTWTGDNTYSKTVAIEKSTDTGNFLALKNTVAELGSTPASATPVTIAFRDKDNDNLGYMGVYYDTDGSNHFRLYVRNKYTSGAPSTTGSYDYAFFGLRLNADKSKEGIIKASFRPYDNNTHDLGSSSYQWNNLYAKNYYYNNVAWGLDKANVWSDSNLFTKNIGLGNITSYTDCTLGFTGLYNVLFFNTRGSSNITSYGTYVFYGYSNTSPDRGAIIRMVRTTDKRGDTNDGYIPDTSFNLYRISPEKLFIDFMEAVKVINDGSENSLKPITTGVTDLGTSTNKWKTLNGINPGALSLPNFTMQTYDPSNGWYDLDTTGWDLTGSPIDISSNILKDGYLYVCLACDSTGYVVICEGVFGYPNCYYSTSGLPVSGYARALLPVRKGTDVRLYLKGTSVYGARLFPALGNV